MFNDENNQEESKLVSALKSTIKAFAKDKLKKKLTLLLIKFMIPWGLIIVVIIITIVILCTAVTGFMGDHTINDKANKYQNKKIEAYLRQKVKYANGAMDDYYNMAQALALTEGNVEGYISLSEIEYNKDIDKMNENINNTVIPNSTDIKNDNNYAASNITNINNNTYTDNANSIVGYSMKFLGVNYVYGGESPSGFDCSGFVQYVYAHFGVKIPRVSEDQQNVGETVASRDKLQPGDLMFWGNPAHHVGMYIGNGKYIQAPHTGDVVKISDLGDYTSAKRILTNGTVLGIDNVQGSDAVFDSDSTIAASEATVAKYVQLLKPDFLYKEASITITVSSEKGGSSTTAIPIKLLTKADTIKGEVTVTYKTVTKISGNTTTTMPVIDKITEGKKNFEKLRSIISNEFKDEAKKEDLDMTICFVIDGTSNDYDTSQQNGDWINKSVNYDIVGDVTAAANDGGANNCSSIEYIDVDVAKLQNYLRGFHSQLVASVPIIVAICKEKNVDPLFVLAITRAEQSFVPIGDNPRIAGNPYNVYHSWEEYSPGIEKSTEICCNTLINDAKAAKPGEDVYEVIGKTYCETAGWGANVKNYRNQIAKYLETH